MRKEFIMLLDPEFISMSPEEVSMMDFSLPDQSVNQTLNEMNIAFIQDSNDSLQLSQIQENDQGASDNAVTTVTNSLQEGIRNLQIDQSIEAPQNTSNMTISEMIERDDRNNQNA
tara:strand:- start:119 stop:463 length:345 start_codon:yes stop_codon:yes gene_type:complete